MIINVWHLIPNTWHEWEHLGKHDFTCLSVAVMNSVTAMCSILEKTGKSKIKVLY